MNCKRCDCQITKRVRHVKINDGITTTVYCRHCFKAVKPTKKEISDFDLFTLKGVK